MTAKAGRIVTAIKPGVLLDRRRAGKDKPLVLTNATIVDGPGREPLPNDSVIVEGERIKEVMPGLPGRIPADVLTIACHHQTLLPGIIDAHVHVGAADANIMVK